MTKVCRLTETGMTFSYDFRPWLRASEDTVLVSCPGTIHDIIPSVVLEEIVTW